VYGAVVAGQVRSWLPHLVPADLLGQLNGDSLQASPTVVHTLSPEARDGVAQAVAHGLASVFQVAALAAVAGLVLMLFLKEHTLREHGSMPAPAEGSASEAVEQPSRASGDLTGPAR
jgi:hypothetical protein